MGKRNRRRNKKKFSGREREMRRELKAIEAEVYLTGAYNGNQTDEAREANYKFLKSTKRLNRHVNKVR